MTKSEDTDEMLHYVAFHQDLHCLLKKSKYIFFLKSITCDPLICTMDHSDLTVSNFMGNSIGTKRVKFVILQRLNCVV